MLAAAEKAGGRIVKPAQKAFWGGWYGYFADVDGHLWEVAHNPAFPIAADGSISLPRMSHDRYDDAYISGILNSVRTIAMVGASRERHQAELLRDEIPAVQGVRGFPGQSRPCRQGDPWPQGFRKARRYP